MRTLYRPIILSCILLSFSLGVMGDVKLRQRTTMSGQTFETVKMIKGSRQRSESKITASGIPAGMMPQLVTIIQCDLKRTVTLNESKRLYFVEPFATETDRRGQPLSPEAPSTQQTRKGGVVTVSGGTTDTGERKTFFGLSARHLKTSQETSSSPDACNGAHQTKMEIDGWYVDFSAEFSCATETQRDLENRVTSECKDRVITKVTGTATPGFLLNGTVTIFDENGREAMKQSVETLELERTQLQQALFEVPTDYKLASSQQELYSVPSIASIMADQERNEGNNKPSSITSDPAYRSVSVNTIIASGVRVEESSVKAYVQQRLLEQKLRIQTPGDAKAADYELIVEYKQAKESAAGKIGGMFGKVTGVDTKLGKVDVVLMVTLTKPGSATPLAKSRIARSFEGTVDKAARAALDDALNEVLRSVN